MSLGMLWTGRRMGSWMNRRALLLAAIAVPAAALKVLASGKPKYQTGGYIKALPSNVTYECGPVTTWVHPRAAYALNVSCSDRRILDYDSPTVSLAHSHPLPHTRPSIMKVHQPPQGGS